MSDFDFQRPGAGSSVPGSSIPESSDPGAGLPSMGGNFSGLGDAAEPAATQPTPKKRSRRWASLMIGGILLLAGAFGGGAAFGWFAHRDWGPVPEPAAVIRPEIAAPSFPAAIAADLEEDVLAPDIRGLTPEDAIQSLVDAGFNPDDVTVIEEQSVLPPGSVLSQQPLAGAKGPAPMTLKVSVAAKVPELVGNDETSGVESLRTLGVFVTIERRYVPDAEPGTIISTYPGAGEDATVEMTVEIAAEPAGIALLDVVNTGSCGSGTRIGAGGTIFDQAVTCRSATKNPTETVWLLNRKVATLDAVVGLDDKSKPGTDVRVLITGDGAALFDQVVVYGSTVPVAISTAGVLRLAMTVTTVSTEATETPTVVLGEALLQGSESDLASLELR